MERGRERGKGKDGNRARRGEQSRVGERRARKDLTRGEGGQGRREKGGRSGGR